MDLGFLASREAWVALGLGVLVLLARGPLIEHQLPEMGPHSRRTRRTMEVVTWVAGIGLVVFGLLLMLRRAAGL